MSRIIPIILCAITISNGTIFTTIDLSNFNNAFQNLKNYRSQIKVTQHSGYCSNSDCDEEVNFYSTSTDSTAAQTALDEYRTEYHDLTNKIMLHNLKTGACLGALGITAVKTFEHYTKSALPGLVKSAPIIAGVLLYSFSRFSSIPETPYYNIYDLEESPNLFSLSDTCVIGSAIAQGVAATSVYVASEVLLQKTLLS